MRTFVLTLLLAASAAHGAITGIVVGDDGKPIAGAAIESYAAEDSRTLRARLLSKSPERPSLATVKSDQNGSFSIDPKANLADIAIRVSGRPLIALQVPDGQDAGVIVVPSQPSRRIRLTGDGKPLANALVAAGPFITRSDAAGAVDLPEVSIATASVAIVHPDFAIQEDVPFEMLQMPAETRLQKGSVIRGKVTAADGAPVEHAVITMGGWPLAETDAGGNFTIAHARPNWRSVMATAGTRAGVGTIKASAPVEIRLAPAATLSGTLRDTANGRGVSAARVTISQQMPEWVISDVKGNFTLSPVAPGRYSVSALHPAYAITPSEVNVPASGSKSIEARPLTLFRGHIIDEQRQSVSGALVWFGSGWTPMRGNAVMSGPAGEFTLRGNVANQFPQALFAVKSVYAMATSGPLNADSAKSDIGMTLPRGFPLEVKVVDKQRQPVAGANVNLFAGAASETPSGRYRAVCEQALSSDCLTTGASGSTRYRIVEGRYDIMVRGETIANKFRQNETLNARSSPVIIEVDRGVEISGRVAYGDGTPVGEAFVTAQTPLGSFARSNADGSFTLRGIPAGPVTIMARPSDDPTGQGGSASVTAPSQNVTITLTKPGRIEGRITDKATRQPITDFAVAASARDMRRMLARPPQFHSDEGTFVLERVPAGAIEIHVSAPGYAPGTLSDVTVEEGKTITGLEVPLERGAKLTGRVTANGQPLSGASVRFGSGRFGGFDMNSTTTDADGQYVIDSIGAGERAIEFTKQSYLSKRKSVELTAGKEARLDVDLERGREVTGRVVDASGRGVSGARVWTNSPSASSYSSVFSDAEGSFKLEGLADGHFTVTASKQGYVNANADAQVPSNETLTLTLGTGGTITGRVIGLSEVELASVSVTASGKDVNSRTTVEPGGAFTLRGIPDGRVAVGAGIYGVHPRQSVPKYVEVSNGSAPPVDIDFSQGVTISGHVTQAGKAVQGGNLTFGPKRGGTAASAQIGVDSSYEVSGLAPGDYNVRVFSYGGFQYETQYTVSGNATFDIDMRGATLRGRVIDATTGAPLPDVNIWTEMTKDIHVSRNAVSDSEGKFVLTALPDATLTIRAARDQYTPATQSVVIASGNAPDVEIRLDRGQEAIFRIVDAQSGRSLNGNVSVSDGKKNLGNGSPGDEGTVRLWLAPGAYRAYVSARGYIGQSVNLVVPGPEMRVALTQGGTLAIMSRGGGRVRLTLVGMLKPMREMMLPPGNTINAEALPAGRYTIDLIDKDGVTVKQSYSVDVLAGQTARLNID